MKRCRLSPREIPHRVGGTTEADAEIGWKEGYWRACSGSSGAGGVEFSSSPFCLGHSDAESLTTNFLFPILITA